MSDEFLQMHEPKENIKQKQKTASKQVGNKIESTICSYY